MIFKPHQPYGRMLVALAGALMIFGLGFLTVRYLSGPEDTWVCQNNQWVKHGNPAEPQPTKPCQSRPQPPDLGTGNSTVSWQDAVELIESCNVTFAAQTHSLDVTLRLTTGNAVVTKEPAIDEIFRAIDRNEAKCGKIPIATE